MKVNELHYQLIKCKKCSEAIKTRQLKCPFLGLGNFNADIMFVGERPGVQPTETGIVFTGNKSGDLFVELMKHLDLNFNKTYITNVVKCQVAKNRTPNHKEITNCFGFLKEEIEIVNPKLIVCVGSTAYNALKDYYQNIIKIYHPAYVLRFGFDKQAYFEDVNYKIKEALKWDIK